jgi:hypothetical protein
MCSTEKFACLYISAMTISASRMSTGAKSGLLQHWPACLIWAVVCDSWANFNLHVLDAVLVRWTAR